MSNENCMRFRDLIAIVERVKPEQLKDLIANGLDVQLTDSQGGNILNEVEHPEMLRILIDLGVNPNQRDCHGWSPLHTHVDLAIDGAIQGGESINFDMVEALIGLNADEKLLNQKGETPRDVAACYGSWALECYDKISKLDWA